MKWSLSLVHNTALPRLFFQQAAKRAWLIAPVLFHCTAGKDRTGIGAYLLLNALEVQPDVHHQRLPADQ